MDVEDMKNRGGTPDGQPGDDGTDQNVNQRASDVAANATDPSLVVDHGTLPFGKDITGRPIMHADGTPVEFSPHTFVHTADLHLAPRTGTLLKRDKATGRLLVDLDRERAFIECIDDVLDQDPRPSAFVIAGDIFDTWRGSQDADICVVNQIRRLSSAGICVLAIAGNHDTPTNLLNTPMYLSIRNYFANDPRVVMSYDTIDHAVVGDVEYVLLPDALGTSGRFGADALDPVSDAPHRVLVVHGVAAGDPTLAQMDEARNPPISRWIMSMGWDYVAFGHYHHPGWVPGYEGIAAYSGSLENTVVSGKDVCMRRGPVYVDVTRPGKDKYDMHPQDIRPIVELARIDATDMTATDVDEAVEREIRDNPERGAVVRVVVRNVAKSVLKSLPRRNFTACDESALSVQVKFEVAESGGMVPTSEGAEDADAQAVDAEGNPVEGPDATTDGGGEAVMRPLSVEVDSAVARLIADGKIPQARGEEVTHVLRELLRE